MRRPVPAALLAVALALPAASAASGLAPRESAPAGVERAHAPATAPADTAARVMVLGVWHFSGGTNVIEVNPARIMKPSRQRELLDALDRLAEFRPTKVAVERVTSDQALMDSLFRAYREGRHELEPSEDQQVGFRMAARTGLDRVHAIDHKMEWPIDTLVAYARAHDSTFLELRARNRERVLAVMDSLREHATVGGILRWFNAPETEQFLHAPYMRMTEFGVDAGYVGVRPVANYYERNLRIFANLTRVVEPGDRVLVVYGAGHQPFLQEFVRGHPLMELVSPLDYLGGG